jgi:hypothetical protein
MNAQSQGSEQASRWPAARRAAWAALFIAILTWSSMLQPKPAPEVLNWQVYVFA